MTEITREQIEEIIGSSAMREYDDTKEWARPDLHRWVAKLRDFSDGELEAEAASAVLDAAIANSRGMYWDVSWVKSSAIMNEADRRHLAAGHDEGCQEDSIYRRGWNRAYRSQGYTPGKPNLCSCGKGSS